MNRSKELIEEYSMILFITILIILISISTKKYEGAYYLGADLTLIEDFLYGNNYRFLIDFYTSLQFDLPKKKSKW